MISEGLLGLLGFWAEPSQQKTAGTTQRLSTEHGAPTRSQEGAATRARTDWRSTAEASSTTLVALPTFLVAQMRAQPGPESSGAGARALVGLRAVTASGTFKLRRDDGQTH